MALSTPPETSPHPATLYGVLDYKVRKYLCEPMSRMGMSPGDLSFDIGKLIVVGHCSTPDPSGASWTTTTVVLQLYIDDPATHTPQLLFESRGANSAPEVVFSDLLDTGVRGVAYRDGVTILTGILADCVRHDLLVFRVRLAFHHEGEPPRHVDLQLDFPWGVDVDLEAGG